MKHYIIYKTTNLINGMIYIGQHVTEDINDSYYGSGSRLLKAIKKYGKKNFKKEILCECCNQKELDNKEKELVNKDFLKRKDVYNLIEGGYFGAERVDKNNVPFYIKGGIKTKANYENLSDKEKENLSNFHKKQMKEYIKNNKCFKEHLIYGLKKYREKHPGSQMTFLGKHHKKETIEKLKERSKERNVNGHNNYMYNKIWIYNIDLEKNITWDKDKLIPVGWNVGKILDFKLYKKKLFKESVLKDIKERQYSRYINKLWMMYNWYVKYNYKSLQKQFNVKISRQCMLRQFKIHIKKHKR